MESEWALNVVREGMAYWGLEWQNFRRRPFLCGRVSPGIVITNDYRWSAGVTIYREVYLPSGGTDSYTFGLVRFAPGHLRFPYDRELIPSPPL